MPEDTTLVVSTKNNIYSTYLKLSDLSTPQDPLSVEVDNDLTQGWGADEANELFHDQRTLAATSEELDLYGVLLTQFGRTVRLIGVKGIAIKNLSTTPGETLTVGGAAANQWVSPFGHVSDKVVLGPTGVFSISSPSNSYAVVDGSEDKLKVDAGGNTLSYDIIIFGDRFTTTSTSTSTSTSTTP